MSNRFPSFQWYPDDWLGSTARATLSPAGRAAYLDLLCHYWNRECKGLLQDEKWLRDLIGKNRLPIGELQKVVKCFKKKGGKLHSLKLQAIYRERLAFIEKAKESGKKGAKKRWGPHAEQKVPLVATPIGLDSSPSLSPSPSSSPSPEEKKEGEKTDSLPPSPIDLNRPNLDGPPAEVIRQLIQKAEAADMPNNPDTLRRYIKAWVARTSGAEVERVLMLNECRGRTVLEIQDAHFKDNGEVKPETMKQYRERREREKEMERKSGGGNVQA